MTTKYPTQQNQKQYTDLHLNELTKLTGLELMQAYVARKLPAPPIAKLISMDITHVEHGHIFIAVQPNHQHLNTIGTVHGGFTATILDSATGSAIHSTLNAGEIYSTIQLNIQYVRPISPDIGELIAEGVVVHRGKQLATAEAYLRDESNKLYAHATASCMISPLNPKHDK